MVNSQRLSRIFTAAAFMASTLIAFAPGARVASAESSEYPTIQSSGKGVTALERVSASLAIPDGTHLVPGQTRKVTVTLRNTGFNTAHHVGFTVNAPAGISISTKTAGWTCGWSKPKASWSCDASSSLVAESKTSATLIVKAHKVKNHVRDTLRVTPFTTSSKSVVAATTPLTVIDTVDAVLLPSIHHRDRKTGIWAHWKNGTHFDTYVNEDFTYRINVKNEGHDVFAVGERLTVSQKINNAGRIKSVKLNRAQGKCSWNNNTVRCELTATRNADRGAQVASIDVTLAVSKKFDHMPLGPVFVKNPESGAVHRTTINISSINRPDSIEIITHPRIHPDAGGIGSIDVRLDNLKNGLTHDKFNVYVNLPKVFTFLSVSGKHWTCDTEGRRLDCTYNATLKPNQDSTFAHIVFRVAKNANTDGTGYNLNFVSDHVTHQVNIAVAKAPVVSAAAFPKSISTKPTTKLNMVLLTAEDTGHAGATYTHTWVQRCTTSADARAYADCRGVVTPVVRIHNKHHVRTHVSLPHVSQKTRFVFEQVITNKSTEEHRDAVVVATPAVVIARPASASAASVSSSAVQAAATVTLPKWVADAMTSAGVVTSNITNTNGVVAATAKMPLSMRNAFRIPDNAATTLSAYETSPNKCAIITVGATKGSAVVASFPTTGLESKYMQMVVAPSAGCSYGGKSYTGINLIMSGRVFGSDLNFSGPITYIPGFKYQGIANVSSFSVGSSDSSFNLKESTVNFIVDGLLGTASLGITCKLTLFGENIPLTGTISTPNTAGGAWTQGMEVKLTTSSPKSYTIGEMRISNLSLSVGIRWTPALGNTSLGNDLKAFYLSLSGTGDIDFFGSSVKIENIEADFKGGVLNDVILRFTANLNIPSFRKVYAHASVMWQAATPGNAAAEIDAMPAAWTISASAIIETDTGLAIGTEEHPATFTYNTYCMTVSGQIKIPGFLDATISGIYIFNPLCPATYLNIYNLGTNQYGTNPFLKGLPMPVIAGDWRFDALNVELTIAGFKATGNVSIGRTFTAPFAKFDANMHFTKSDTKNMLWAQGEFNPLGHFSLKGEANLDVAGLEADFKVDAALTPESQHIDASTSLDISGTKIDLGGSFALVDYKGVKAPSATFTASVNPLRISGFDLGGSTVTMHEGPDYSGTSTEVRINVGVLKAEGKMTYHYGAGGILVDMRADTSVDISSKWKADLDLHVTNCADDECTKKGNLDVRASGSAVLQGKEFNLGTFHFNTDGHFKFHTKHHNKSCDRSGNIGGVQWEGCFSYAIDATLSDQAPYLEFDADASLHVKSRTRNAIEHKWRGWDNWGTINGGIDISFDPFKLHLRVGSIKVSFDGK